MIQTRKIEEHLEEGHEKDLEMCRNKNLNEIIWGYQIRDIDQSSTSRYGRGDIGKEMHGTLEQSANI